MKRAVLLFIATGLLLSSALSHRAWAQASGQDPKVELRLLGPLPGKGDRLTYQLRPLNPSDSATTVRLSVPTSFGSTDDQSFSAPYASARFEVPRLWVNRHGPRAQLKLEFTQGDKTTTAFLQLPLMADLIDHLYPTRELPPWSAVTSLSAQTQGRSSLVVGTKRGLSILAAPNSITPLSDVLTLLERDQLLSDVIQSVALQDSVVWVSTQAGLCALSTTSQDAVPVCLPDLMAGSRLRQGASQACVWGVNDGAVLAVSARLSERSEIEQIEQHPVSDAWNQGVADMAWVHGHAGERDHLWLIDSDGNAKLRAFNPRSGQPCVLEQNTQPWTKVARLVSGVTDDPQDPGRVWAWRGDTLLCLDASTGQPDLNCMTGATELKMPLPEGDTGLTIYNALAQPDGLYVGTTASLLRFSWAPSEAGARTLTASEPPQILRAIGGPGEQARVISDVRALQPVGPPEEGWTWIGTLGGLYRCQRGQPSCETIGTKRLGFSSQILSAAAPGLGADHAMWLGDTQGAVHRLWQEGGTSKYESWQPSWGADANYIQNSKRPVHALLQTPGAPVLWVGGAGLHRLRFDGSPWGDTAATFGAKSDTFTGAATPTVLSLTLLGPELWVGTDKGLFHATASNDGPIHLELTHPGTGKAEVINALVADPQGRLWVATPEHLLCYDPLASLLCKEHAQVNSKVEALYVDEPNGLLWYATSDGALHQRPLSNRAREQTLPSPLPWVQHKNAEVRAISRDLTGRFQVLVAQPGGALTLHVVDQQRWLDPVGRTQGLFATAQQGHPALIETTTLTSSAPDVSRLLWAGGSVADYEPPQGDCPPARVRRLAWGLTIFQLIMSLSMVSLFWRTQKIDNEISLQGAFEDAGKAAWLAMFVVAFFGLATFFDFQDLMDPAYQKWASVVATGLIIAYAVWQFARQRRHGYLGPSIAVIAVLATTTAAVVGSGLSGADPGFGVACLVWTRVDTQLIRVLQSEVVFTCLWLMALPYLSGKLNLANANTNNGAKPKGPDEGQPSDPQP